MRTVESVYELHNEISRLKATGITIGFVPTMGALHEGHIELVNRSVAENGATVVSIFVNPTQFNDKTDLDKYPRTLEADCALLRQAGCTLVFAPTVEEMYPKEDTRVFDFAPLDTVMEGPSRPGHFNGVAQIVSKLFDAVQPDRAYFGLKDFQQLAIICRMVEMLAYPIQIVPCPTVREDDGLARSSRNSRLTPQARIAAPQIYATLRHSLHLSATESVERVKHYVEEEIAREPLFRMEYFEIVDGHTLQPIASWSDTEYAVGCIALFDGDVRLIDNIVYK